MKRGTLVLVVVLALILSSCSPVEERESALKAAVQAVKDQYAPDRRVAVFDINWQQQGNTLVVKGEVDDPVAKSEVLAAIVASGAGDVVDSIRVLPDPALGSSQYGIVIVSVANMRTKPEQSAELGTQVLMGVVVKLLKKQGAWYYVQSHDRYLGWVEGDALHVTDTEGVRSWEDAPKVIATEIFGFIREQPDIRSTPVSDIVAGSMMRLKEKRGQWMEVELADERSGFVQSELAQPYQLWQKSRELNGANIEKVAKGFIGLPYLWGGTSVKGMDCSGFTKMVFRLNGKELNRDANQQALMGEEVILTDDFRNVSRGDLLFFGRKATDDRPERISHVGIYLSNKHFIHSSGRVRINSLDPSASDYDEFNHKRLVRARRIIGLPSIPEIGGS